MNNYELANQEACKYEGVLLRDSDKGEFWHCVGLLIAADDIYYEVIRQSDGKRMLLSFVGDLDSYGFVPVVAGSEEDEALSSPPASEWDGEGLPPVGCECEGRADPGYPWLRGVIMYSSPDGAVFKPNDEGKELFWLYRILNAEFRPLRTKEQLERDEAIKDAGRYFLQYRPETCPDLSGEQARKVAAFFYDAGMLRKAGD